MNANDNSTAVEPAPPAQSTIRPLRIWPALIVVGLMFATRYVPMLVDGGTSRYWMLRSFGPLLGSVLILIWWLAVSRATWKERVFGSLGLAASCALVMLLLDPTMRGPGVVNVTVPMGGVAFAVGALCFSRRHALVRTGGTLLLALAGFGFSILLRIDGLTGDYELVTAWRWSPTSEDKLLAASNIQPLEPEPNTEEFERAIANPEWPGFRGADRAAISSAPPISTDWFNHPPRLVWKIQLGPGWSSFAVAGHFLFTQEQRGPEEMVVCYDAQTGREVWHHAIEARLEDPMGGPGPRATPTLANGGLFATTSTGFLLRLDPRTGTVVWTQNLKAIAGSEVPMWGFAASPLVAGSLVITYAAGPDDKGVLAFDTETGEPRWSAPAGKDSYSSPQLNTLAGESLVLMTTKDGLLFLNPTTGQGRLNYEWIVREYRALQPRVVGDDTILLPTGMNAGTRAIRVTQTNGQLQAEELWSSRAMKPDFSDVVTYGDCAYGIDAGILACVDLKTGERRWKGGRYGKGQLLVLKNSGLLLIAGEQGQVVLLRADPDAHLELGSFPALAGKTWNHPVVVGDRLYLRNSQEAACYQLPPAAD